jgi:lysyl-tRNA synthetase class 2
LIFDSQYEEQRKQKAQELKRLGYSPYNNQVKPSISVEKCIEKYKYLQDSETKRDESKIEYINGRVKFFRVMGKASFMHIEDESGLLQIYISRDNLPEGFYNDIVKKMVDIGDFIQVSGFPFFTNKGEFSLHIHEFTFLTKALSPLPEKYHGITDKELRYRQRYLDLIMNKDVKDVFKTRSNIVSLIRRFFESKSFLEVETPMLHPIAGGANAKPFITRHNALGEDRYMRIAPELYLKRLIVGGFESVFEINRNFRNEGIDHTHNPEFTMLEFYWAYKQYDDLINITEELISHLLAKLDLPTNLPYKDMTIDFSTPFARVKYTDAIRDIGKVDEDVIFDKQKALELLKSKGLEINKDLSLGHIQAELFDEFVEDKLINPTFITHFPIAISPLARRSDDNPEIAERFEMFIAGAEIANGFNELNDPIDQYERFENQIKAKDAGDDEAHQMDIDYVKALGYGMPPTAGEGLGIDRLVMILANQSSIKDVLLFPALKHINS